MTGRRSEHSSKAPHLVGGSLDSPFRREAATNRPGPVRFRGYETPCGLRSNLETERVTLDFRQGSALGQANADLADLLDSLIWTLYNQLFAFARSLAHPLLSGTFLRRH